MILVRRVLGQFDCQPRLACHVPLQRSPVMMPLQRPEPELPIRRPPPEACEAPTETATATLPPRPTDPETRPPPAEETWASATPVAGSSVAMPSGYGPSRGKTTPGWGVR